jgi:hypothetical protein
VEKVTDEEIDLVKAIARRESGKYAPYPESGAAGRSKTSPAKQGPGQPDEPGKKETRDQHQKILEEKYGSGIAYSILKLFERYEELVAASPKTDSGGIEEIEKILVNLFLLWEDWDLELSSEQEQRNKTLHDAFIKKYRLEPKLTELEKEQDEKKSAEKRIELERKYGTGKSLEELIKLENDEKLRRELGKKYGKEKSLEELLKLESANKRRKELEKKYGKGKSLEELERLEKNRLEKKRQEQQTLKETPQYFKDLYG